MRIDAMMRGAVFAFALVFGAASVQAATCSDPNILAADVSGFSLIGDDEVHCEAVSIAGGADTADDLNVANGGMGTFAELGTGEGDAWTFLTKYQVDFGESSSQGPTIDTDTNMLDGVASDYIYFTSTAGSWQDGTFYIDEAVRALYAELLVVFKGQGDIVYAFWITDISDDGETATYHTPFGNYKTTGGRNGATAWQEQAISHITFYGRLAGVSLVDVPVPAAAPLLLGALGVVALAGRRR